MLLILTAALGLTAAAQDMPGETGGDGLPISLQPAMGPVEPHGANMPATGGQPANGAADAGRADTTASGSESPDMKPAMPAAAAAATETAAGTAAQAAEELRMPVIADVLPHFLGAGLLAGMVMALLLVLLIRRGPMAQRTGAALFASGALLFVMAYTGVLSVLLQLPPAPALLIRLATLAEALMLLGAGWWLVGWLGVPQGRVMRVLLMMLAGMALSLIILSPLYPASLLPVVRALLLALTVAGLAALLWPQGTEQRHPLGHVALAGLFAWAVLGLLLTLKLFAITSATAVLLTSGGIVALAALVSLAALASGSTVQAENGNAGALAGADALPFRYEPHSDRLKVPARLAEKLHFPPDVLESVEGFMTIVHPQDRPLLEAALRAASLDEPVEMTLRLADGGGVWRTFMLRARALQEHPRAPRVISGLLLEETTTGGSMLSGSEEEEDSLKALHDPLTGLPGQALLLDRLDSALTRARRGEGIPCLIIVDVDRFRAILDALGIAAGDLLVVELARRLQQLLNEGETVARLPADQFALIIDAEQHGTPLKFIRRIREMLAEPFDLDGREAVITVSIGVVDLVAAMMLSAREAIRAAEIALFEARRQGPGHEAFYTPDMHGEHARLARMEQDLRRALKMGELEVHYQPVVWLNGRLLAGFEALLRWRHPERGLIGPEEFLGLAEEIGLMRDIGQMVLRESIRQLGIWQRTFRTEYPFYIAVNIATADLLDPSLAEEVAQLLVRENADAAGLKIEVTEHLLMQDPAQARATLLQLAELGVGVYCDDFGTGHSSLARLRTLPFDALKIDRAFLGHDDPASRGIIAAVVELAHGLSMRVVAEGVEEAWQLQMLEELGCDMAQGYLLAEPLDGTAILQAMTEARRIAPFSGRLLALSHILLHEDVAPPLPEDIGHPQLPAGDAEQPQEAAAADDDVVDGDKVVRLDPRNANGENDGDEAGADGRQANRKPPAAG